MTGVSKKMSRDFAKRCSFPTLVQMDGPYADIDDTIVTVEARIVLSTNAASGARHRLDRRARSNDRVAQRTATEEDHKQNPQT